MELTELRDVPPKMRSAPVVIGMIAVSSGSDVDDDELEEPVEVSTPTTVIGTPLTSTVWPDRVLPAEQLRGGRRAQHDHGGVVGDVLVVDETTLGHGAAAHGQPGRRRPLHRGRRRLAPGRERPRVDEVMPATALMSGASTREASAETSAMVRVEAVPSASADPGARRRAARRDGQDVGAQRVDLRGHLARGTLTQADGDDHAGDADQDAEHGQERSAAGDCARR